MSPDPPHRPLPTDKTIAIFHLRQGFGPNSDSQIRSSSELSPEEFVKQLAERTMSATGPGADFIALKGAGDRIVLIARAHLAWIEVKPLTEHEQRRLREQLDLAGVQ